MILLLRTEAAIDLHCTGKRHGGDPAKLAQHGARVTRGCANIDHMIARARDQAIVDRGGVGELIVEQIPDGPIKAVGRIGRCGGIPGNT